MGDDTWTEEKERIVERDLDRGVPGTRSAGSAKRGAVQELSLPTDPPDEWRNKRLKDIGQG